MASGPHEPTERPPRLLLAEDDEGAARVIRGVLESRFGMGCVTLCRSLVDGLTADYHAIDLALVDMHLPDGSGLQLVREALARRADLPVVMLTTEGVAEEAVAAIQAGAYDYVIKGVEHLHLLPMVVQKNLTLHRVKQENQRLHGELARSLEEVSFKNRQLEEAVAKLRTMAATDVLTGLANRRALNESLDRCFAEAQRHAHDLGLLMIDLDGFKQINDTLGHRRGDELLRRAGRVLQANCRRSDIAGRFGGDEFVVLLPHTSQETGLAVASRISRQFRLMAEAETRLSGVESPVTMSLGLATLGVSRASRPEQLLEQADQALYRAKQGGRDRIATYSTGLPRNRAAAPE